MAISTSLFTFLMIFSLLHCFVAPASASFHQSSYLNTNFVYNELLLEFDFYRNTCPNAEAIVHDSMVEFFTQDPSVSAQLLRMFFHDCFIGGCDGSIMLDESGDRSENRTEKDAVPNKTLQGFDKIELIKSRLEEECPTTVTCADILALATRDGVTLAGGPFYGLLTGRGDSHQSHFSWTKEIPRPDEVIESILDKFEKKGFSVRETVSLLASHNIGHIGCQFIVGRLSNLSGSGEPDPTLKPEFLEVLTDLCTNTSTRLSAGSGFDQHFFKRVAKGTALLFSDQQLLADEATAKLVNKFATSDGTSIRRDFGHAMSKLSSLHTVGYHDSVRKICSKLPPATGDNATVMAP